MKGASNFVEGVDQAFYFILGIDILLLIVLTTIMIVFIVKFNRKRNPKPTQVKDKIWVEVTWTTIPLIIVLAMFWYGYIAYSPMQDVPDDAMNVTVVGKMWNWDFIYENGKESDTLYVPFGKAVKLNLKSIDVLHGLYIPAFRLKEDVVPGEDTYMWFVAGMKDTFEISCSAYCGLEHSMMGTKAIVLDSADFKIWYADVKEKSPIEEMPGFVLLKENGCMGCHTLNGESKVAPTFQNLFGSSRFIDNGNGEYIIKADEEYIKRSILDPNAEIEKGFQGGIMRSYKNVLSNEDIDLIIEYFKTAANEEKTN